MKSPIPTALFLAIWISGGSSYGEVFPSGSHHFIDAVKKPEIVVNHPKYGGLKDGTAEVDCGKVKAGQSGRTEVYVIRNTGTAPLRNLAITKSGTNKREFSVSGPSAIILAPGAAAKFTVTFKPVSKGPKTAAIQIANNDVGENPFDIKLIGIGGSAAR